MVRKIRPPAFANQPRLPDSADFSLICDAPVNLVCAAANESDGEKKRPTFKIDAYSGRPLMLADWYNPIIIDLAGLRANQNTSVVLDHDTTQIVGQSTVVENDGKKLKLSGVITGDLDDKNDPAAKVVGHARRGFIWKASIGARAEKIEFVDEGQSATVNGRTVKGPILIARSAVLNEVSFLAAGADETARAQIAASAAGDVSMAFDDWLKKNGIDATSLTDRSRAILAAAYSEENAAQEVEDDPAEPAPKVVAGAGNDPAVGVKETLAAARKAIADDHRRISKIRELCGAEHADLAAKAIEAGWSPESVELELYRRGNVPSVVSAKSSAGRVQASAIEAAMLISAGVSENRVGGWYDDRAMNAALSRDMRNYGLHALMYEIAAAAGMPLRPGRIDNDAIRTVFDASNRLQASGASTISLPGILSNVANKRLLDSFLAYTSVVETFCSSTEVADFKQYTNYRMTGSGRFQKVGPDGELKHGSLLEDGFTNKVETYGELIVLTLTMMQNDDLNAFLKIPAMLGRDAAAAREEAVFTVLLGNAGNFFHANNKNFISGGSSAFSIDALSTMYKTFREQVDKAGRPINIMPVTLLVPPALRPIANVINSSMQVTDGSTSAKPQNNPHAGRFRTIVDSPLMTNSTFTGYSATAWYAFADPMDVAAIDIGYLRGARQPVIEQGQLDYRSLGAYFRGFWHFGVAYQDPRGAFKSAGA